MQLDWSKVKILHEYSESVIDFDIKNELNVYTEIAPEEYYLRAKELSKNKDANSFEILDIITYSNKVIDCKCSNILKLLGFSKKIDKYLNLKSKWAGQGNSKITFISNLTGLNTILLEELKKMRKILEHEYNRKKLRDVLLLLSCF